jgi:valyl-tRNA synthetase
MSELSKAYEPQSVEEKWYSHWIEHGHFTADPASPKPAYSIVIPPPNVTGVLTLGHVLNNTLQDILARRARQTGHEVLWLPGTDHAGIATQTVVERKLRKEEKKTRHDLGRDEFLKRVWDWKDKHGGIIINQLKKLGCSCDWTRERFTMDDAYARKVQEVFVDLHAKGLIYRGKRMVNWCPVSLTALSDEEVIPKTQKSFFYHYRVEVVEKPGTFLEIATTRPETIMADTAVAVNPKDPRYAALIGLHVRRPLPANVEAFLPIIGDEAVDFEFGTGVLKVTPAHDKTDYEIGLRHKLPVIDIFNPDATLNELAGEEFAGLDRFEARAEAIAKLKELGILVKEEPHENNVGFSERADVPIEPRLSEQWFLKYPKTTESRDAVRQHLIRFFPDRWEKVYDHWLENIQDWCISRQLWWGHRIPVWYPTNVGQASRLSPETNPGRNARTTLPPIHFDELGEFQITQRHLPHWEQPGATYSVTFRLADSLPESKVAELRQERELWLANAPQNPTDEDHKTFSLLFSQKLEQWLDAGMGSCLLKEDAASQIVENALRHFDGERYDLGAWSVMPNHVHVVFTPKPGHELKKILHSWKSFTAHELNKLTGNTGPVWISETYDHIIRNDEELWQTIDYVESNAPRAGLKTIRQSHVGQASRLSPDPDRGRDARTTSLRCQIDSPGEGWVQDPDVLDTWFSSWLWAHETMDAPTLKKFFPTSVLVTGPDIIFFWVARMIMASLEYTGQIPFRDVYFTGIIRDKQGRKMSKSLGNSPDPLDLIAKFGADGIRFGLLRIAPQGQDIKFDEQQIVEGRNFCNKLWNACRFRQMQGPLDPQADPSKHELSLFARDLLARLDATIRRVNEGYDSYKFSDIAQALYDFVWGDFCDRFIEVAKSDFATDSPRRAGTLATLDYTIKRILQLLHPYAPFLTEELWHGLGLGNDSIQFSGWPEPANFAPDPRAEAVFTAVSAARNLRATYGIQGNRRLPWQLAPAADWVKNELPVLAILLHSESLTLVKPSSDPRTAQEGPACQDRSESRNLIDPALTSSALLAKSAACPTDIGTIHLPLEGIIDPATEAKRLDGEIRKVEAEIEKVARKLSSETFVQNAPAEVVADHRQRQQDWIAKLSELQKARSALG